MEHSLKLKDLLTFLDTIAPLDTAEKWDNVGLMIGNPAQHITGVLIALDPTLEVVEEAIDLRANTIITHHPLFSTLCNPFEPTPHLAIYSKKLFPMTLP